MTKSWASSAIPSRPAREEVHGIGTVGNYAGGPAPIGSGYKVRIQTVSGAIIYSAQSANSFTIFIAKPITKPIIFHPIEHEFIRLRISFPTWWCA